MIISDDHRYVYVELPRTGSTAVAKELIAQYGGRRILKKHSTYLDFVDVAEEGQLGYFVFSSIRNPLDDAVSRFYKMKTDHHGRFSDPVRRKYRVGNRGASQVRETGLDAKGRAPKSRTMFERLENRKYQFIARNGADFESFFKRFYWLPYDTWARLSHEEMDFVIRFENLQADFSEALRRIGVEQTRPLPVINKTGDRALDFTEHYTEEIIPRARRVFGPYMRQWGYAFPDDWGQAEAPVSSEILYRMLALPRTFYWKRLRSSR